MMRAPRVLFDWLDLKRSIAILVVVGGGYAWYVYAGYRAAGPGHPEAVVMRAVSAAPLAGFLMAPALIGLIVGYVGWVKERIWTPWQGRYHAFDDHQIRVVESRDDLWFCSADIHRVLGMPVRPAVLAGFARSERLDDPELGCVLSNAGLSRLLGKSTDRLTLRLLRWADHDVLRLWKKQHDAMRSTTNRRPCHD